MSYPGPGPQPILLIVDGDPVSGSNPLPTTGGGGGGGTVDQGTAGSALQSWYVRDGSGLLATAAKQDAGNASLASILGQLDSKTSTLATASAQTTGNNSLSSIDSKVATAAKQDTGNTSLATIATQQTDGSQKATVTQGAGSGAAGTFWYTRNTDGTNTQPTMDTAARSGYQRITDGTNTATVKAASTAPTASDTALVATLSPNSRPGGGSSFTWFSSATGSLLKTGAGVVRRIIIGSNVAGTVTLHDNTSATGTVIASVTSTTSTPCNQVELGVAFSTGLYCTTTGSGISVTVVYD